MAGPVAVLLAAGAGSRFGGPTHKLLAPLHGRPVVAHALDHAVDSHIGPVVVVTGAIELDLEPWRAAVIHVVNERWADGQATSLALAGGVAADLDASAMIVGLGDQPFVPPETWRLVATAGLAGDVLDEGSPERRIVVASYDGRRGPHPVRLPRSLWELLPPTGDDGARTLIRGNPALVCEVPCPGSAADIDTLEDLERWTSS